MTKKPTICFTATVNQVKTLADGGLRFSFDTPESSVEAAAQLMLIKQGGGVLEITGTLIPEREQNAEETNNDKGGSTRKTRRYPYHT